MLSNSLTKKLNNVNKPIDSLRVRLIPDLSAVAFQRHLEDELGLWICLRALNNCGNGVLPTEDAISGLINYFGYSERSAYRQLRAGNNKLWTLKNIKGHSRIEILGLFKVSQYFGLPLIYQRHFREVPSSEFSSTLSRRAHIYASIHKPEGIQSNPVSRAAISRITGLSKVQQIRYEKHNGIVKKTPNYAMHFIKNGKDHVTEPVKILVKTKTEEYYVNKRLPNIYHTTQLTSSHGMLKGVSRSLKATSLNTGEAVTFVRRYFKSFNRLYRGLSTRGENSEHQGYYLINNAYRKISGRLEWGEYSVY